MTPGVRKFTAVLGVFLVFVLGMAAGAAVTLRIVRQRAESLLTERGSDLATERLARRLGDQLRCDAAQRVQIGTVFRNAHGELREMRQEVTPRLHDIFGRAAAQIRTTLRPDQQKTFDEIVARQTEQVHLNDGAPGASSGAR